MSEFQPATATKAFLDILSSVNSEERTALEEALEVDVLRESMGEKAEAVPRLLIEKRARALAGADQIAAALRDLGVELHEDEDEDGSGQGE